MRRDRPLKRNIPKRVFNARKRRIFYSALKQRLPYTRCAELAGISYHTFRNWMKKGEDRKNPIHRRFWFKVNQIVAQNEREALDIIRKASTGGSKVVETKVVVGARGTETTRTWKTALPVWQAAAWYLERRHKDEYSRDAKSDNDRKSVEEQANEVKEAFEALSGTIPANEADVELPDDMPE